MALASLPLVAIPSRAAEGSVVSIEAVQWNMQQLLSQTQAHRDQGMGHLYSILSNEHPLLVSLNEVCPSDAIKITQDFAGQYSTRYARSYTRAWQEGNGDCKIDDRWTGYGNLIMMRLSPLGSSEFYYSVSDSGSRPGRNVVCMRTGFGLLVFAGCSTHLSSPPGQAQRNEFIYVGSAQPATARFLLGDLNANRTVMGSPTGPYFTTYREADLARDKRATADGGSPIDYIFGSVGSTSVDRTADIERVIFSDHHVIRGFFAISY